MNGQITKMAKAKVIKSKIPWFVSIPRSGANWIQGMMSVYFQKPHGPLLKKNDHAKKYRWHYPEKTTEKDLLFVAHHDQQGFDLQPSTSKEGDIFLYRNPMDVVYSNIKRDKSERRIQYFIHEYKRTFNKWAVKGKAKLLIRYEDMVKNPSETFQTIVEHFNFPWSEEKFEKAYNAVTRKSLVERAENKRDVAFPEMLTEEYAINRDEFRRKYTTKCKNNILTDENNPWLSCYFKE